MFQNKIIYRLRKQTMEESPNSKSKINQKREDYDQKFTIEEVFKQVSQLTGPSLISYSPSKFQRTCLTPHSEEACLKHGIDPEVLRIRDFDSFWEASIRPEIQHLRHDAYSKRRHELMKIAREERYHQQNEDFQSLHNGIQSPSKALTREQILEQEEKSNSTLIEMEERHLAKLKQRKEKEMLSKFQYEAKMQEIRREMKEKEERELLLEERRRREIERKDRQAAEERRLRELRRKEQETAEEVRVRALAQEMFERELAISEERVQKEREREIQARIAEENRQQKIEEQRLQIQRILERKMKDAEKKGKDRQRKERLRQQQLEQRRRQEQILSEAKKKLTAERLEKNKQAAKKREEGKKEAIIQKRKVAERNRQKALIEQKNHKQSKQKEREIIEQKRQMQLRLMKEQKEERKKMLQQKFDADDIHLHELNIKKNLNLAIAKEKRELIQQLKQDNVLRIKRAQAYQSRRVLEKIQEDDQRTQDMMKRKNEIAMHRKQASIEAKRQKDMLGELLGKMQGANSMQKVKEVLSGKSNRKDLRKTSDENATVLKLIPSENIKPEAPSLEKRISSSQNDKQGQRYKSPYE